KTVNIAVVRYLAYGSIPGAIIAIGLLRAFDAFFDNQDALIKHALGFMLILVAITTICKQFTAKETASNRWQLKPIEDKKIATMLVGLVLGFMVGLTSIGSGSMFAIALLYLFRMPASEVVGTDIAHAFLLVTVAGLLHAGLGNVNYMLALNLRLGSIPGVLIGSTLSARVPSRPLRTIVAALIFVSGLKLI